MKKRRVIDATDGEKIGLVCERKTGLIQSWKLVQYGYSNEVYEMDDGKVHG
eukprot:CAMPEP_0182442430 /NCGR_PEP_ID=MMETSP1172-20130603/1353_1 /TAXON_ID=708627 /ORGANISM="Timspurckia oligopyrenoides, Strain CCMP3278" /LENGTH=50 /DNA_ID=CAMNT_0024637285 /DNA_START=1429 /DNA_END=1584 /DNA_ORIENTATION=+